MAASTISPATLNTPRAQQRRSILHIAGYAFDHWHLLSLDAPTVAVVWTASFAAALRVHLPILGPVMLALATWLLYVADRLLDSRPSAHPSSLQARHCFHLRHRGIFLGIAVVALPLLAWLVFTRLDAAPLREDLVLTGCSFAYLTCVHFPLGSAARQNIRLPKELIVGIIFAAACGIPTWSRASVARPVLLLPLCLFAALCWINCVAIEYWEAASEDYRRLDRSTLLIGRYFSIVTGMVAFTATTAAVLTMHTPPRNQAGLIALYLATALSSVALTWLHHHYRALDPLRRRAAADAVLLTPAILLPACMLLAQHLPRA